MYLIGDFARLARISVRMLRHYDDIGLLRPAHVDRATGYRWYSADQLPTIRRVVEYRGLGFSLDHITRLFGADRAEQRALLVERYQQVTVELQLADERLSLIEAHLTQLDKERTVMTERKHVPAQRYAVLHAWASGWDDSTEISRVLPPLYPKLIDQLNDAGVGFGWPSIAYYTDAPEGEGIRVTAGFPVADDATTAGIEYLDLAAGEVLAAVHHGPPSGYVETYSKLVQALSDQGLTGVGYSRELYIDCPADMTAWVTELQIQLG